jgi:hypothetical protein
LDNTKAATSSSRNKSKKRLPVGAACLDVDVPLLLRHGVDVEPRTAHPTRLGNAWGRFRSLPHTYAYACATNLLVRIHAAICTYAAARARYPLPPVDPVPFSPIIKSDHLCAWHGTDEHISFLGRSKQVPSLSLWKDKIKCNRMQPRDRVPRVGWFRLVSLCD